MNTQEMKEEALNTHKIEESDTNLNPETVKEETAPLLKTKEDVLNRLTVLLENADDTNKQEIDSLQQSFHRMMLQDMNSQKEAFLENGGVEEEFTPVPDPLEKDLKTLVDKIKQKRKQLIEEENRTRQANLALKQDILKEIKAIIDSGDGVNNAYDKIKELQTKWNEIKLVPQSEVKKLWNTYHLYIEQFYDLLKLNNEFREYDFKKNLELKEELCKLAEELDKEEDVVSAFHQLQNFHQQWREIGPVAKELRDQIWDRFKNASTIINKKHQDYFEALKAEEESNLKAKSAICEKIEGTDYSTLTNFSSWKEATDEVLKLQEEWKTIGFTPKKANAQIFDRYRKACDLFFEKKAAFFKDQKENIEESIKDKIELCEKAEALKDSTDWKRTSEALIELQKQWKKTKPVYRKQSEMLWTRFSEACDYFFERRNKEQESKAETENKNLEAKKLIIQELKSYVAKPAQEVNTEIRELTKRWNEIGHVPFKQKDVIYKEYKALVDRHYDNLNEGMALKKMSNFKDAVSAIQEGGDKGSLIRERERLNRTVSRMKGELQTYENNLGFLTLSSKKGNSLITDLNNRVDKLRADIAMMEEKISFINKSL